MNEIGRGYRSPRTLSLYVAGGIALVGLCTMFALLIGIAQIASPAKTVEMFEQTDSPWLLMQGLIALIQGPAYIFTAVMFLVWLYRVYTNLPALMSDSTEFSPGWAVGWWFIPFANLVKPFQVVRNAWAESDPDFDPNGSFLSAVQAGAPGFMAFWWAFWLLANIAANITGRLYDPDDIRTVELSGYFFVLSGIFWGFASVLAIKVVRGITERQDERFKNIGLSSKDAPPPPPVFNQT